MHKALLFAIIFALPTVCGLSINEVMYDYPGDDTGHEWIEIYDDGTNLSELKLSTGGNNHWINFIAGQENATGFVIVSNNANVFPQDHPEYNGSLFYSSFSLLNAGDQLLVKNGTDILENFTYDSSIGGAGNNNTICRFPDASNTLAECQPTPGYPNVLYYQPGNSTINSTAMNSTDECDIEIGIIDSSPYYSGTINFELTVNDLLCNATARSGSVSYWIDDMMGNTVKPVFSTNFSLTCAPATINRQWSYGAISGSEAYVIKASATSAGCHDASTKNNYAEKTVIAVGEMKQDSSVEITEVSVGSDASIKFGEHGEASLSVYKGDTSKTSVDVYVKDAAGNKLSDITNANLNSKYTNYSLNLPIMMKANCDGALQGGSYMLFAEGLNTNSSAQINVSGTSSTSCKTVTVTTSSGGGGGGGSCTPVKTQQKDHLFALKNYTASAPAGQEITTEAEIQNNAAAENFTVYSYVYKGNDVVSSGYDAEKQKFLNTYDANKRTIELPGNSSSVAFLKNTLDQDAQPGLYSLRVRIKHGNKTDDITNEFMVSAAKAANNDGKTSIVNATDSVTANNSTNNTAKNVNTTKMTAFSVRKPMKFEFNPDALSPISVLIKFLLRH